MKNETCHSVQINNYKYHQIQVCIYIYICRTSTVCTKTPSLLQPPLLPLCKFALPWCKVGRLPTRICGTKEQLYDWVTLGDCSPGFITSDIIWSNTKLFPFPWTESLQHVPTIESAWNALPNAVDNEAWVIFVSKLCLIEPAFCGCWLSLRAYFLERTC